MFHVVITEKHKMSIHSFCSEKINEAVSILGKGVGVTFVSKALGVYNLEDGSDIYGMI